MISEKTETLVAVFESAGNAKAAVERVQRELPKAIEVSALVQSKHDLQTLEGALQRGDSSESHALLGAGLGGLVGLFAGALSLATMGVGALLIAGPAAALTGGIVGGLVGSMAGWGVPRNAAKDYVNHLNEGHVLLLMRANPDVMAQAMNILGEFSPVTLDVHAKEDAESPEIDDRRDEAKKHNLPL